MKLFLGLLASLVFAGCITGTSDSDISTSTRNSEWLQEGTLVIARPLPEESSASSSLFGFMPQSSTLDSDAGESGLRLVIDSETAQATVLNGALKLSTFPLANVEGLNPGSYEVMHKQRHPVWYATDAYFENRGLPKPDKNSKDRYLKGALGDFVIYLDDQTALHNSAVFANEVGGIRLSDNDIAQIYYQLEVGARVVVE